MRLQRPVVSDDSDSDDGGRRKGSPHQGPAATAGGKKAAKKKAKGKASNPSAQNNAHHNSPRSSPGRHKKHEQEQVRPHTHGRVKGRGATGGHANQGAGWMGL